MGTLQKPTIFLCFERDAKRHTKRMHREEGGRKDKGRGEKGRGDKRGAYVRGQLFGPLATSQKRTDQRSWGVELSSISINVHRFWTDGEVLPQKSITTTLYCRARIQRCARNAYNYVIGGKMQNFPYLPPRPLLVSSTATCDELWSYNWSTASADCRPVLTVAFNNPWSSGIRA